MIRNRQPHDINPLGRLTQWLCSCKCPRLVPIAILFVYKGVEFLKTFSLYSRALQAKLQHPRPRLLFADVAVAATPDAVADCVMSETLLYPAVKRFLEARGFDVKGEVKGCDIVSVRREETLTLTIVEMKLGFTLELLLQVTDRMRAADEVWLAVPATRRGRDRDPRVHRLCRLLGFGLMAVRAARDAVDVLVEPGPYQPRRDHRRRSRLLSEHARRRGDPSCGGMTRQPVMTAYRQQALACAALLSAGPGSPRQLRAVAPDAGSILLRNVYGWFERTQRGVYRLTAAGEAALRRWPDASLSMPRMRRHLPDQAAPPAGNDHHQPGG